MTLFMKKFKKTMMKNTFKKQSKIYYWKLINEVLKL
jgi:hypothetical protein